MTDLLKTAGSVWDTLTGFLSHHADELNGVAQTLSTLVNSVPLDHQDKENVTNVISGLGNAAENIKHFLENSSEPPADLVIKKSDVLDAVREVLNSDDGKALLKSLENPTPPNA